MDRDNLTKNYLHVQLLKSTVKVLPFNGYIMVPSKWRTLTTGKQTYQNGSSK